MKGVGFLIITNFPEPAMDGTIWRFLSSCTNPLYSCRQAQELGWSEANAGSSDVSGALRFSRNTLGESAASLLLPQPANNSSRPSNDQVLRISEVQEFVNLLFYHQPCGGIAETPFSIQFMGNPADRKLIVMDRHLHMIQHTCQMVHPRRLPARPVAIPTIRAFFP